MIQTQEQVITIREFLNYQLQRAKNRKDASRYESCKKFEEELIFSITVLLEFLEREEENLKEVKK